MLVFWILFTEQRHQPSTRDQDGIACSTFAAVIKLLENTSRWKFIQKYDLKRCINDLCKPVL